MPGTPGTLSVLSPISAWTSTTLSGPTPNFSATSGAAIRLSFIGSNMVTVSFTSCMRSLSDDTMTVWNPLAVASLAKVAIRSSAS